jgi:ABC-type lipoprotein export system ATPase subunit
VRSRWRCSRTGRRGRQEGVDRRARAFAAGFPRRLAPGLEDVRAGGIGWSEALFRRRLRPPCGVGFVFQFFHLIPELTGEENVLLPARLPGMRNGALARGRELIAGLGLEEAARRLPHELSGGEQQRLAVARALVHDPPLVLADEPTGNLDAEAGAAVLALLREAAGDGRAVVLVTHDEAATAQADRVLRLREGRLE